MLRSLNTAERTMQIQQVRIDALANNLANVNTTGFRGVLTRVAEIGAPETSNNIDDGMEQPQLNQGEQLVRPGSEQSNWVKANTLDINHATDVRRGAITATGRDTDVALISRGFFALQTDAGERYTRGGSFSLNEENELTTPDGRLVLGKGGPMVLNGENFSIENNGQVLVDGEVVGQFKVVDFADPTKLQHLGGNLLMAPEGMEAIPVPPEEVVVAQGHLEGSNVNPIDTLVAMIQAQRAFEVQSKIMTTEDDLLSKTVNNLPRISGS